MTSPARFLFKFNLLLLVCIPSVMFAKDHQSWGRMLDASSQYVEGMELVYWEPKQRIDYAVEVLRWFSKLPYYQKAFSDGKVIVGQEDNEGNEVYNALKMMTSGKLAIEYKGIEGTAKAKGFGSSPFDESSFVVIRPESLDWSNGGLVHELLHHYYWASPTEITSKVEEMHDAFVGESGKNFKFKDDPGHIFVWGCQFYPMGYGAIIDEQLPGFSSVCAAALGNGRGVQPVFRAPNPLFGVNRTRGDAEPSGGISRQARTGKN